MRGRLLTIWILFLVFGFAIPSKASHIVGGEMTYVYVGRSDITGSYQYKITLTIYEDCLNGQPDAIAEDNPGIIFVYDMVNGALVDTGAVFAPIVPLPANFNNSCIKNATATCLEKRTFTQVFNVPYSNH